MPEKGLSGQLRASVMRTPCKATPETEMFTLCVVFV